MKNIVVIAPARLPLPSVKGGAIETLFTHLLNENEHEHALHFEVFSYGDASSKAAAKFYKNSTFHFFEYSILDYIYDKLWALIYRMTKKRILARSSLARHCTHVLSSIDYDMILVEGNYFQVCQLQKYRIPIIYHLHTDILNANVPCCKTIVDICSKIIVVSDYLKRQITNVTNVSDKVFILKNAINTDSFVTQNTCNDLLQNLGIPKHDRVVIYCGRIVKIKGVFEMVKAFKEASIPNLSLLIVGGSNFADSHMSAYEKEIKQYILKNNLKVFFTGYVGQTQLPLYYNIADFSICPSICDEAAGLVIIEAHSCGLPVIATNKGGIPEYVCHEASILVEYNDSFVANLSNAIRIMYDNYSAKKQIVQNSQYRYHYSVSNYYKNFLIIVNSFDK